MLIFGMHTKSSRRHAKNEELPELTFCGLTRREGMFVVEKWKKVNCGNCIAVYATGGVDTSFIPDTERGRLYADSGQGGTVTYWEKVQTLAYALDRRGQRLAGAPAVDWQWLQTALGVPLRRASLGEIRTNWLDARLAEGDL